MEQDCTDCRRLSEVRFRGALPQLHCNVRHLTQHSAIGGGQNFAAGAFLGCARCRLIYPAPRNPEGDGGGSASTRDSGNSLGLTLGRPRAGESLIPQAHGYLGSTL